MQFLSAWFYKVADLKIPIIVEENTQYNIVADPVMKLGMLDIQTKKAGGLVRVIPNSENGSMFETYTKNDVVTGLGRFIAPNGETSITFYSAEGK